MQITLDKIKKKKKPLTISKKGGTDGTPQTLLCVASAVIGRQERISTREISHRWWKKSEEKKNLAGSLRPSRKKKGNNKR